MSLSHNFWAKADHRQRKKAVRALNGMEAKGFDVNPKDPTHIQVYITMRQWSQRIYAADFVSHMNNMKTSFPPHHISTTGSCRIQYWGVPKENFPHGLSPGLIKSEVHQNDIAMFELVGGGEIDTAAYFLIDQEIDRNVLGRHVRVFEFSQARTMRPRTRPGGPPTNSLFGGSGEGR